MYKNYHHCRRLPNFPCVRGGGRPPIEMPPDSTPGGGALSSPTRAGSSRETQKRKKPPRAIWAHSVCLPSSCL